MSAGAPFSGQAADVLSLPYMLPTITDIERGITAKVDSFKGTLPHALYSSCPALVPLAPCACCTEGAFESQDALHQACAAGSLSGVLFGELAAEEA